MEIWLKLDEAKMNLSWEGYWLSADDITGEEGAERFILLTE